MKRNELQSTRYLDIFQIDHSMFPPVIFGVLLSGGNTYDTVSEHEF